jgi:hypothetical protein
MASRHALNGRIGALESWSRTADRTARTAAGHKASPVSIDYWINKLREEGIVAEADLYKAAEERRRAHMLRLARRSAEARRKKRAS